MTRTALALAALLTLSLNGSIAVAASTDTAPQCNAQGVCAISLRMLTPPPARPAVVVKADDVQQAD